MNNLNNLQIITLLSLNNQINIFIIKSFHFVCLILINLKSEIKCIDSFIFWIESQTLRLFYKTVFESHLIDCSWGLSSLVVSGEVSISLLWMFTECKTYSRVSLYLKYHVTYSICIIVTFLNIKTNEQLMQRSR